jgi:hypothetical protein
MSINPLNDISKVYLEQVRESAVPGKPAERLGAVTAIPKAEQDAARERLLAKAKAMREKKGIKEAAKPDYLDFDEDGNEKESMKKALKDKKKHKVKESNDGNLANNYPPYDKVTRGDVIAGALGKDQQGGKKKKVIAKEGYSNWREDLIEVVGKISKDKSEDVKITEKQVNNKINVNPKLDLGEAVENLGGTLLEMVEIDEVDYIVESVYDELLDEGYDEDDIEEALEFALTEAKVTFGHDTDKPYQHQKKSGAGQLIKAVGRLARQKLSSKVRGAKKEAGAAVARGARKVAKGALNVARKVEGGDKTPSTAHTKTRTASTYRGAGAGQKEKVSSGSYTPPTKKKAEKPADPWGNATVPQKPKPKPKPEKPADPWGSATTPPKPKAKKKKAAAPKATKPKSPAATAPKKKRGKSKLDDLLADIRGEQVQIDEKTLSAAETKEKERIVKSMKDKVADFEKRYPGRGKEVMYATATKMAKKIAEQAMELQPKTQQQSGQQNTMQKKAAQQKDRQKQQEVQILQRKLQALRSAPKGVDTDITA